MQKQQNPQVVSKLNGEIDEHLGDSRAAEREKAARRIQMTIAGIARKLNLNGEVKMFGSFSNGFKTGGSDLDIVFAGNVANESVVTILSKFAKEVERYGYDNITTIFSASVPIVKFTDRKATMEVDFCINNDLGVRNSKLLHTYCTFDSRVLKLGRVVKDWAKKHELVGVADGCLNSYAYMLLALHYLLQLSPPVIPNLQMLEKAPFPVSDNKWGGDDVWETQFLEDTSDLPRSENTQQVGDLLLGFFHFYLSFDWRKLAVCMRLSQPGVTTDKFSLTTPTNDEQWYVEDPFDLKHNLAGKCSRTGRKRILDEMDKSLAALNSSGGSLKSILPENPSELYFLKCRISQGVTPQALLEEFEDFDLTKLHFPKPDGSSRMGQAFLEFNTASARRRAHSKNESYVADCQLQLHYTSQAGLAEAVNQVVYSTYEMASYKMKKQILAARVNLPTQSQESQPQHHPGFPEGAGPPMPMMMPPHGPFGAGPPPAYPWPGPPPYAVRPGAGHPHLPGPPPHPAQIWDPLAMPPKKAAAPPKKSADESLAKAQPKTAEAKSKLAEAKAAAAQAKVAKVSQQAEAAKKGKSKIPVPAAAQVEANGWLNLSVVSDLPKGTPMLNPEQAKQLEDLASYFRQFKSVEPVKGKEDHVVVHCELQNLVMPPQKILKDHEVNKVKELQKWMNSRK